MSRRTRTLASIGALLALCAPLSWVWMCSTPRPPGDESPATTPPSPTMTASALPSTADPETAPLERSALPEAAPAAPESTQPPAATQQTFAQFLADFVQRGLANDSPAVPAGPEPSAELAASDPRFNPNHKQLSPDQLEDLRGILRAQVQRQRELELQDRQLTREALKRSVERGLFVTREQAPLTARDPAELARQAHALATRSGQDQREMQDILTVRLGQPMRDWAYSACATSQPDGVGRQTIVYFTRRDAPEVFACRDTLLGLRPNNHDELRRFFANLP